MIFILFSVENIYIYVCVCVYVCVSECVCVCVFSMKIIIENTIDLRQFSKALFRFIIKRGIW